MTEAPGAAALVTEVGEMIAALKPEADGISVVVIMGGGSVAVSGYSYVGGLPPQADIRAPIALFGKLKELQAAMERERRGKRWLSALFQIWPRSGKATVAFEYEDALRWKVTPANIETLPEALRPGIAGR